METNTSSRKTNPFDYAFITACFISGIAATCLEQAFFGSGMLIERLLIIIAPISAVLSFLVTHVRRPFPLTAARILSVLSLQFLAALLILFGVKYLFPEREGQLAFLTNKLNLFYASAKYYLFAFAGLLLLVTALKLAPAKYVLLFLSSRKPLHFAQKVIAILTLFTATRHPGLQDDGDMFSSAFHYSPPSKAEGTTYKKEQDIDKSTEAQSTDHAEDISRTVKIKLIYRATLAALKKKYSHDPSRPLLAGKIRCSSIDIINRTPPLPINYEREAIKISPEAEKAVHDLNAKSTAQLDAFCRVAEEETGLTAEKIKEGAKDECSDLLDVLFEHCGNVEVPAFCRETICEFTTNTLSAIAQKIGSRLAFTREDLLAIRDQLSASYLEFRERYLSGLLKTAAGVAPQSNRDNAIAEEPSVESRSTTFDQSAKNHNVKNRMTQAGKTSISKTEHWEEGQSIRANRYPAAIFESFKGGIRRKGETILDGTYKTPSVFEKEPAAIMDFNTLRESPGVATRVEAPILATLPLLYDINELINAD